MKGHVIVSAVVLSIAASLVLVSSAWDSIPERYRARAKRMVSG